MGQYFVLLGWGRDGFSFFYPQPALPCSHPALIRTIIVNLENLKSLIFKVKHKTCDKIFFILIPTTTATLWPFSLLYTCFSSFKLDSTPTLLFRFISLTIFPFVLVFLKLVFFNLNFGSCFLSKIGIFVYSYWRSTVGRKKGNGLLVLPVGLFLIIFQMFQFFFFFGTLFHVFRSNDYNISVSWKLLIYSAPH